MSSRSRGRAATVAAAAAIWATVFTAHAGASAGSPSPAGQTQRPSAALLRIPFPQDDGSLTPYTFDLGYSLMTLVYDTVLWRDANGVTRPWLADSVTTSPDGLTVTIHVAPAATWQDGPPVTSADVAFTFAYVAAHPHARFTPEVEPITGVDTPDSTTAVVHLSHPSAGFDEEPLSDVPILPQHLWANLPAGAVAPPGLAVGSGPYRMVSYTQATGYRFEAVSGYFRGTPAVKAIDVPVIRDAAATISALEHGTVDALPDNLNASQVDRLRQDLGIRVETGDAYAGTVLLMNTRVTPFDNASARRAVADSLDLPQLAVAVGLAVPATREISGGFTSLGGSRFGFSVGPHDSTKPLVIDPAVVYSTYLGGDLGVSSAGGSGNDGNGVAPDAAGSAYVTGRTFAPDFPTTAGAFQTSYFVNPNGLNPDPSVVGTYSNAFISKLTPDGSGLVYSTYLGGSGGGSFSEGDVGRKVKLDAAGDAYVVGTTDSPDFPTTSTALVPSQPGGPGDIFTGFLSKLSSDGSQLLYSTYLNGFANDLAVDASGRAVLAGSASPGFTTTANTNQATCHVCADFTDGVATSGSTTFTSATADFTYLDAGSAIYDPTGTIFPCCGTHIASVTDAQTVVLDSAPSSGGTTSFNIQARQADLGWVGEIDPNVAGPAGLVYSSLVGADYGTSSFSGLAIDASGKIVVAGTTSGLNFPTTSGAAQGGCRSDCPFNHDGVTTNASTTFTSASAQFDVNVDAGQIIQSPNLPAGTTIASVVSPTQVTLSAAATAGGSAEDFFIPSRQFRVDWIDREYRTGIVAKLDPTVAGTPSLAYSSYLGGSGIAIDFAGGDVPQGVAVDAAGNAYVTGSTGSPDFPTTSGVFSRTCNVTPGAACRGLVTFHDGVTTAGSTTFTSASADFLAQDARKNLFSTDILGPGESFAFPEVVDNATTIELNAPAAASATGVTFTLVRAPVTDAFVTKLNASGTSFLYSTFLGGSGSGSDAGAGIAVDSSGRASVMGGVGSPDFPLLDPVAPYAPHGAFITQLAADASSLVYSTTIGGNGGDAASGIAVDPSGATYVVGSTSSTNFPTTPGALKTQTKKSNAFVIKIAAVGSSVPIATGVQPASRPLGGGSIVTITGHGFSGATAVHFGSVAAVFAVHSDTQIVATSPAQGAYGVQLVTVTTPGGTSPANPIDSFTYTEGQWSATHRCRWLARERRQPC